eukprot:snap_masked-scaffold_42-processed-gene-2.52-mRNA-1 protein AED:1.00 eAED:1.00 QI:0/0/0/0/1/1/5/0/99
MLFLNSKVQRGSRLQLPVVFVVLEFLKSRLLFPVLPALYHKLDTSTFPFFFSKEKYFALDPAVYFSVAPSNPVLWNFCTAFLSEVVKLHLWVLCYSSTD